MRILFAILLFIAEYFLIAMGKVNADPTRFFGGLDAMPFGVYGGILSSVLILIKPIPRWLSIHAVTLLNWGLLAVSLAMLLFGAYNIFPPNGRYDYGNYHVVVKPIFFYLAAAIAFLSFSQLLYKISTKALSLKSILISSAPLALIVFELILLSTNKPTVDFHG